MKAAPPRERASPGGRPDRRKNPGHHRLVLTIEAAWAAGLSLIRGGGRALAYPEPGHLKHEQRLTVVPLVRDTGQDHVGHGAGLQGRGSMMSLAVA